MSGNPLPRRLAKILAHGIFAKRNVLHPRSANIPAGNEQNSICFVRKRFQRNEKSSPGVAKQLPRLAQIEADASIFEPQMVSPTEPGGSKEGLDPSLVVGSIRVCQKTLMSPAKRVPFPLHKGS